MGLGALAMAGGQLYGGYSAYEEGKDEASIAKYNAAVKEQEAKSIETKTKFEQMRAAEAGERTQQELEANIVASGGVSTLGSPLLAAAVQASELELKNLLIGQEGQTEAARARSEAEGYRMEGRMARARGRSAFTGSLIGMGGTLLGGLYEPTEGSTTLTPKTSGKLGKQLKKAGYFKKNGFKSKLTESVKKGGKFGAPKGK